MSQLTRFSQQEILAVGDDGGGVSVFRLSQLLPVLQEKQRAVEAARARFSFASPVATYAGQKHAEIDEWATAPVVQFSKDSPYGRGHADHVTNCHLVQSLSWLFSSSLDGTVNLFDYERGVMKNEYNYHKRAVYSFSWHDDLKLIASGGLDREVLLWSPYSDNIIGTLRGHNSPVMKVVAPSTSENLLITLGLNQIVKVWDLRNFQCLQTMEMPSSTGNHGDTLTNDIIATETSIVYSSMGLQAFFLHDEQGVSYGGAHINASHQDPIVQCCYSDAFQQIVAVDRGGRVKVWDPQEGFQVNTFSSIPDCAQEDGQVSIQLVSIHACNATPLIRRASVWILRRGIVKQTRLSWFTSRGSLIEC